MRYRLTCFLIRYYRIVKHKFQFLLTKDVRYKYEIDHYKEMKLFTCLNKKKLYL